MAKKGKEEIMELDMEDVKLDEKIEDSLPQAKIMELENKLHVSKKIDVKEVTSKIEGTPSCLINKKARVIFISRPDGKVTDPKHVAYGGLLDTSFISLTVPRLTNGNFVNVLTDDEKNYLEQALGMEQNALSVYKKDNNFWENYGTIKLNKFGVLIDLSDPMEYIKYKVIKANKSLVAPSYEKIKEKGSYKFYIELEGEQEERKLKTVNTKAEAYMHFGKIEESKADLTYIIQVMTNKPISRETKLNQLKAWVGEQIEANTKLFLSVVKDEYYHTKKLLYKAVEYGIVKKHGDNYYMFDTDGLKPIGYTGEEGSYIQAVKYLNAPKNQEFLLRLEARVNQAME